MSMIPLESAKSEGFRRSTIEELRSYLDEMNIVYSPREAADYAGLKSKLLRALGMTENAAGPVMQRRTVPDRMNPKAAQNAIVPPYNLRLDRGEWEGRRHRLTLHKGDDAPKREKMRRFSIEGYVYEMEYGRPYAVPEPFWEKIRSELKPEPKQVSDYDGNVLVRTTNVLEMRPMFSYHYDSVDPATADRCGSLQEWYFAKGPEWFMALTFEQLQRVAKELDVPIIDQKSKLYFNQGKLLNDVCIAVFSEAPLDMGMTDQVTVDQPATTVPASGTYSAG